MPLIDDLRFRIEFLGGKMDRINAAADALEKKPTDVRLKNTFIAMTEGLDALFSSYDEAMTRLVSLYSKQTPQLSDEDLKESYENFEKAYYNVKAVILTWLPAASDQSGSSTSQINQSVTHPEGSGIALPKIILKEFSGDLLEWQSFHDLFIATVHANKNLSDIQKFMYLKSSVKGEAYSVISSIPLTGTNYAVAWETLLQRYNNTDRLTNAYLTTLFDMPILSIRDASKIRPFRTTLGEVIGALKAVGHDVDSWSVPIIFLLRRKLSSLLRERWEKSALEAVLPTVTEFLSFLDKEATILEAANPPQSPVTSNPSSIATKTRRSTTSLVTETISVNSDGNCVICSNPHPLSKCKRFLKMNSGTRLRTIKQKRVCLLCFSSEHFANNCNAPPCSICSFRHNELLCFKKDFANKKENSRKQISAPSTSSDNKMSSQHVASLHISSSPKGSVVLLATAKIFAFDINGVKRPVRALIDCASQGTFVTEACVRKLGCKPERAHSRIFGFGQADAGRASGLVRFQIQSMSESAHFNIEALVVDRIAQCPKLSVDKISWPHVRGLLLADSEFFSDYPIDILLGSEWFAKLVIGVPIQGPEGTPDVIPTVFGHCLLGKIHDLGSQIQSLCSMVDSDIRDIVKRFWEVEEPPQTSTFTPEDKACESHYNLTVSKVGHRYVVRLPFREQDIDIGDSFSLARRRFHSLEKRLDKSRILRSKYNEFMQDLLDQGHMVKANEPPKGLSYYVPHHCIFRPGDEMSRFRVVFDCSMKTDNGVSLNQVLHVGPKLQMDIIDILVRFRIHDIVFTTDIRQMYRNIRVHENDLDFQRIFWRFDSEQPVDQYKLTTVIYGMASSPFLAIRTLHKLVEDEGRGFPDASKVLLENTFMDDCCPSVNSLDTALELQRNLIKLLAKGGFELRKWKSNKPELLQHLPDGSRDMSPEIFNFHNTLDPATAVLGLSWNPIEDTCLFHIHSYSCAITKRTILSEVARLFDPLGLLCPITFYGKWMIQELWHLGLSWDDPPPQNIIDRWNQFRGELPLLSAFSAPRSMRVDSAVDIQLHAFADASEKGYAAMIYIRSVRNSKVESNLLLAKSKVAPVRKITLPRLELLALVLAARLVDNARRILLGHCSITKYTVWSDSLVALQWVKSSPHKWKTFVANRISTIQEKLDPDQFHYVPSALNPSDIASRGALPRQFLENVEWCSGPSWLSEPEDTWPKYSFGSKFGHCTPLNDESKTSSFTTQLDIQKSSWMLGFCSFSKPRRFMAYWLRYFDHLRSPSEVPWRGPSTFELRRATIRLVYIIQEEEFSMEIRALQQNKNLKGHIKKLSPFLDQDGVIRVGGRLQNAKLISFGAKHPILLPKQHHLTKLIIDYYHEIYLHPGALNLHCLIQSQFWIVNAREVIRSQTTQCVKCFRTRPKPVETLMGSLPSSRLTDVSPFHITGVDYAGPYNIRMGKLRNAKIFHGYICLFVCLSTRAIHLELVSDLTTDGFLGALRRFIARRGAVSKIHSDGGTNFVGAKRKIEAWAKVTSSHEYNDHAHRYLTDRNIDWKLLPGNSPHMGGIWESNIKSCKRHLTTVIGHQILTYEELYTVLVQIESVLNSRPLVPISSDPTDCEALTPGHFLLQQPVTMLQEPDSVNTRLIDRWELIQKIVQSFWNRWKMEFLNTLQIRGKWTKKSNNIKVGQLVVIKDDNLPPCRWRLARVSKVFPGADGVVRVAEVRIGQSSFTRSVAKLCPLPIQED